jgi:MYXO-CTERM domain-containing protein
VDVDLAREGLTGAPAIGDLDGDGKPEIVISSFAGTLYVIGAGGTPRPGWPRRLPEIPSCPRDGTLPPGPCMGEQTQVARGAFASPVLEDMNGDGNLDIIQAAFDGKVYVFDAAGEAVDGFPVELHYDGTLTGGEEPDRARILTTPAIADFNGDGISDLVVGSNEKLGSGGQAGAMYIIDGRGMNAPGGPILPKWPVTQTSFDIFPLVAEGIPNSPVVGRFEGKLAAVFHGNASLPLFLPADPGTQTLLSGVVEGSFPVRPDPNNPGQPLRGVDPSSVFGALSKAAQPNTMLPLFAQPSLGDIDQDGVPDVITSGGSLTLAISLQSKSVAAAKGDNLLAVWSGKTGAMMPASPYVLEDFTFFNNQAIADLNGDDYPEIITGSGGYFVHAYDACGREPKGWPKFTGQWIIPTVAVGDLDGDGKLELATGTRNGWLYVWHTEGSDEGIIEWESYHHDNRNTGSLETPLDQGSTRKAPRPLTTQLCIELTAKPAVDEGGCQCAVGPGASEGPVPGRSRQTVLVLLAAGMMALLKRRRRH